MSSDAVPDLGARVVDRDDDDPDVAVVVARPDATAVEWDVDDEHTVATFPGNEPYSDDAPVVVVVFRDALDKAVPEYDGADPLSLRDLADRGVSFYTFPAPRLAPAPDGDADQDQDGEPGAPKPDPTLLALTDHLVDRGVTVEYDAGDEVLRAEKLGEMYRIYPDGTVDGDGALRDRLEAVVDEVVS